MKRGSPVNWRTQLVYTGDAQGQIYMPLQVYNNLVEEGIVSAPEVKRIGESFGNSIICGMGVEHVILNVHPESISRRFMPELIRKEE